MQFLLDANIPYSAKEVFPEKFTAFHVRDIGLEHASDEKVLAWARKNKAVTVTRDLDFANILNFPAREYYGIVVLRIPSFYSAKSIKRVLADFVVGVDVSVLPRSIVIVEEGRYRVKRGEG